jgi:hypothetical protein
MNFNLQAEEDPEASIYSTAVGRCKVHEIDELTEVLVQAGNR